MADPAPRRADPGIDPGIDLGIDTAADDASLVLMRGDAVIAERAWRVESTMSRELLAALDALLRGAGVARTGIASITVATGPGQYGALRTGIATAQGLALALDVPLAGVPRLEADALPHLWAGVPGRTVIAVHDAGRSGLAWAAYTLDTPDDVPRCLVAPRLDPPAAVAHLAPRPATWCGELTDALHAARDAERRSGDTDAGTPAGGRAAALVRLARRHAAYGDPALVDAIYLRPPPITLPRGSNS